MDGARCSRTRFDGAAISALRAGDVWDTRRDRLALAEEAATAPVHLEASTPELTAARGARLALRVTGLAPWPPPIR